MKPKTNHVFVIMGSNIQPIENMQKAIELIKDQFDLQAISTFWETPPVGTNGPNYYNAALLFFTAHPLDVVKTKLREIEAALHRVRTPNKFAPRTMDLDVVLFDNEIVEPRLCKLAYIAIPLAELIPDLHCPENNATLKQIAGHMLPTSEVKPHPEILPALLSKS